jgi:plastocyanin
MRPRLIAFAAGPLATLVVAAGCGGSESSEPVATTEVTMAKSYRFDPKAVEIQAGQRVTWTNDDNFTHSVEIEGQAAPIGVMKPGESVTYTFATPGHYPYLCTFHPQDMRGVVEVVAR